MRSIFASLFSFLRTKPLIGLLGILILAGGLGSSALRYLKFRPPQFLRSAGKISLAERLTQPPTYNYGSAIHFWSYDSKDGAIAEVAITGHADSTTCAQISAQEFDAYRNKFQEPEDFLVGGEATIKASELQTAFSDVKYDPSLKKDPLEFEREWRAALKTYKDAPPEYHLRLAQFLATEIIKKKSDDAHGAPEPSSEEIWNLIQSYWSPNSRPENEDAYAKGRTAVMKQLMDDPAQVIREAVANAEKIESDFVRETLQQHAMPGRNSKAYQRLLDATRPTYSSFDLRAFNLATMQDLLRRRALGEQVAVGLSANDEPDLLQVNRLLTLANRESLTPPPSSFVYVQERLRQFIGSQRPLDQLTRREFGGSLYYSSESLLRRIHTLRNQYSDLVTPWRDHSRVAARVAFEDGEYQRALEILFAPQTAVKLFAPEIRYTIANEALEGRLGDVLVSRRGGTLRLTLL